MNINSICQFIALKHKMRSKLIHDAEPNEMELKNEMIGSPRRNKAVDRWVPKIKMHVECVCVCVCMSSINKCL